MQDPNDQANFLWANFQEMTNNGTELPDALGIFVDNSGSQFFNEVNDALFLFIDRVKANYPNVILPSDNLTSGTAPTAVNLTTDPNGESIINGKTGVFRGVSLAGAEDWINQSQMALQNLIDNDPNFKLHLQPIRKNQCLHWINIPKRNWLAFLIPLLRQEVKMQQNSRE